MHKSIGCVMLLLLASASAVAPAGTDDERDLLKTEAAVCSAFESGNAKALGDRLDQTFTLVNSSGVLTDRSQNLAEVAKRDPSYDVFRNLDQHVRLYGDAAVITGITRIKGRSEGKPFAADFRYTDTWIQRDGHWLLVASHASKLPAKQKPSK